MITWGHLRRFVVGVGLVVALGACQSGPEATPPPSPVRPTEVSASSTPTASATSSDTEDAAAWARVPEAARAHTFAGAQAFAEFYVGQINRAWTTPDPELLRPYGLSSCKSCANYVGNAAEFAVSGHRYARAPLSVVAGAWLPESTGSVTLVSIVWAQRSTQITARAGTVVETVPSSKGVSEFELHWTPPGWRVAAIRLEGTS